jgi:hypothetical protein
MVVRLAMVSPLVIVSRPERTSNDVPNNLVHLATPDAPGDHGRAR